MIPAERADEFRNWLVGRIAALAGRPAGDVDPTDTFTANGLDSVRLARLAEEAGREWGGTVDPVVLFENPTVDAVVDHLTRPPRPDRGAAAPAVAPDGGPVAVVGLACRMPGAADAAAFWDLLLAGRPAVGPVPPDRWSADLVTTDPAEPGRMVSGYGGFLDDVAGFDAGFFRITGAEADGMDPQQRLLLETCWDAVQDAAEPAAGLRGSATGVFVGISTNDYAHRQIADRELIGRHTATGNSLAVAANRVSYVFDWRGPSVAVDTACSSSLVAVHLAVRALRSGECDRAVAGGVNVILDPELSIGLSKAGMLAPDGRCKTFDAEADGYVRGEGCGVVVLKRLADAVAAGDRIYAVIGGSAVNSDGGSNGLTAPNPAAQRAVLRAAWADAGTSPAAAGYLECHGTGTLLGDPIEARSLAEVRGTATPAGGPAAEGGTRGGPAADGAAPGGDAPLLIGSVKTNIGHLESAAGIAALIKTVLAVHHGTIPPSLNFRRPNPAIPFDDWGLRVVTEPTPWPAGTRYAGVSGFGFGGTNAHVVLTAAPAVPAPAAPAGPLVVPLTGRGPAGLAALARDTAELAAAGPDPARLAALAATMATRRTRHRPYRLAVAAEPADLVPALRAAADRLARPGDPPVAAPPAAPAVCLVFSGQGGQWAGMGRELLATQPLFRSTIRRCDEAAADLLDWSIEEVLAGDRPADLDDTAVAQVLIVAVQLGLAAVWECFGVRPAAVVGHSVGEISAAVVAGALSLPDGIALAVRRGAAMGRGGPGAMLAVGLDPDTATARYGDRVDLAAVNSPGSAVLSGPAADLDAIAAELAGEDVWTRRLPVAYGFHSRLMDGAAVELAGLPAPPVREPGVPFFSTVLAGRIGVAELTDGYWARGVRAPVRFADAVTAMLADAAVAGGAVLLEVGPRPVLGSALRRTSPATPAVSTVDGEDGQWLGVLRAAADLYRYGVEVDWRHVYPDRQPVVSTPGHPWDRTRHWIERRSPGRTAPVGLLGAPVDLADAGGRRIWQAEIDPRLLPSLADHRVGGTAVFPAAGYAEILLRAAEALDADLVPANLAFVRPLPVDGRVLLQCTVDERGGGRTATVHARPIDGTGWQVHATADLLPRGAAPARPDLDAVRARCPHPVPTDALYAALAGRGLSYGPAFRGVADVLAGENEALAALTVPAADPATRRARLLDAACHAVAATVAGRSVGGDAPVLPVAAGELTWWGEPDAVTGVLATVTEAGPADLVADVLLLGDGAPVALLRALRLHRTAMADTDPADGLRHYRLLWREQPAEPVAGDPGHWLVLAPPAGPGLDLARKLATDADRIELVVCAADPARAAGETWLDPTSPADFARLIDRAGPDLTGVLHLLAVDDDPAYARTGGGDPAAAGGAPGLDPVALPVESALHLIRAVTFAAAARPPRLVLATVGAQPVGDRPVTAPLGATLWGLAKTLPIEHPLLPLVCVDLDPAGDPVPALRSELAAAGPDAEVGYAGTARHVRRIVAERPPAGAPLRLDPEAVYLVTGGTGALGLQVAGRLADRGARHLVLVSRHGADGPLPATLTDRCDVRVVRADVADRAALAAALAPVRDTGRPLRGVVHAAGLLDNGALLDLAPAQVRAVLAPKVLGATHLHELTAADPLDWFVLFSSAAGVLGSPGQANYTAANAWLDSYAHHLRAAGRAAVSVDWGPWADAGMAAEHEDSLDRELRVGASAILPAAGLDALEAAIAAGLPQPVVLPFDLSDLVQFYPSATGRSFLSEITTADAEALHSIGTPTTVRPDLAVPYVAPRDEVERRIVAIWQKSMGIEPIGVHDRFFELGGDSVLANQILVEVNRVLGVRIQPDGAFTDFTVEHLARMAQEQVLAMLDGLTEDEAVRRLEDAHPEGTTR
ncbi:SDR family NAD(P)-dependent oxidoreductase [Polymorphospora sp. NPDC050346]|uniref:SDR family NAD(P)-dependent oxidoreductase n=1 Tax=Polymorphospora sp. NPDC050346 TaxID=3155780 RepID=UPI0033F7030F